MPMKGQKKHIDRLKALTSPAAIDALGKALFTAGDEMKAHAQNLITQGSVSGDGHIPSKPGSPPNNNSGILKDNIECVQTAPLTVEVSSNAPYAAIQEFGGTIHHPGGTPYFMRDGKPVFVGKGGHGAFHTLPVTKPHDITLEPRPYMAPTRDALKGRAQELVQQAINHIVKTGA